MRNVEMKKGRIIELIVEHDDYMIVFEDEQKENFELKVSKDTKIMNDEHFVRLDFDALKVRLPVYVYIDKDSESLLFIIIAQNEDSLFQILDVFDEKLISSNKMVKINDAYLNLVNDINLETPVKSLLANQQLLVFYHVSTKSIPALIEPVKIIIL